MYQDVLRLNSLKQQQPPPTTTATNKKAHTEKMNDLYICMKYPIGFPLEEINIWDILY